MSEGSERTPLLRVTKAKKTRTGLVWSGMTVVVIIFFSSLLFRFAKDLKHLPGSSIDVGALEEAINTGVSNASIASFADEYFLAGPHLMGQNRALAEWTRQKFEDYGFKADIETYEVLRNVPIDHSVRVLEKDRVVETLKLEEDVLQQDPTTGSPDRIPTFHGYGASGNATGEIVYANYGRKRDFDLLEELGIDIVGKIVLVRYGGLFRGLKVLGAQERGALGVLIFSDPIDDGEITESNGYKPYPYGPARNPSSVQRGSVQNIALQPGDPTTPGYASIPGVNHTEPVGLPKIPSIPISQTEGLKLLKYLNGHGKNVDGWEGGLDAQYSTGPSSVEIEVFSELKYEYVPIYNVIATLEGHVGETVVVGNHRDSWILGGADPNSGSAAMLEVARVFGELAASGWKPFRTIQFSSWDGEEYGLVGSTEHGENHASFLQYRAVAYLNLDVACSGPHFKVGASPLLDDLSYLVAKKTRHPHSSKLSLFDYWAAQQHGAKTYVLGSGSDFTVFLDHLGVPSLDIGFSADSTSPAYHYHSNYDSLHWMKEYGDPTFERHASVARYLGITLAHLSIHTVMPFRTLSYAELLKRSVKDYFRDQHGQSSDNLDNFKALLASIDEFEAAATIYDAYLDKLLLDYNRDYKWWQLWAKLKVAAKLRIANLKLFYLERSFLDEDGLDGRPFFKHIVFAPGRYTGYSGQILPGIGEAVEDKDDAKLKVWLEITQNAVEKVTEVLS